MKQKLTYSFIIPYHNTPDLLQRLINSIPQREDIEIIVVDDNSDADKKANIKRQDVKTIYIDKNDTMGAGKARNVGMSAATGKWLLFADSDDFYKAGFINVLDEYRDSEIEILFFNVESVDSDTLQSGKDRTRIEQEIIMGYNGSEESTFNVLYTCWGPWRKMLSTEFVKKYGFFYEEVPNGNDVLFSLQTSYFVKKWKVDKRIVYVLTYRQGSITYSKTTKTKYVTALNNIARRAAFFKFLGHSELTRFFGWKGVSQSIMKYVLGKLVHHPMIGIRILVYYIFHYCTIKKNSSYYVDTIKNIERNTNGN